MIHNKIVEMLNEQLQATAQQRAASSVLLNNFAGAKKEKEEEEKAAKAARQNSILWGTIGGVALVALVLFKALHRK